MVLFVLRLPDLPVPPLRQRPAMADDLFQVNSSDEDVAGPACRPLFAAPHLAMPRQSGDASDTFGGAALTHSDMDIFEDVFTREEELRQFLAYLQDLAQRPPQKNVEAKPHRKAIETLAPKWH